MELKSCRAGFDASTRSKSTCVNERKPQCTKSWVNPIAPPTTVTWACCMRSVSTVVEMRSRFMMFPFEKSVNSKQLQSCSALNGWFLGQYNKSGDAKRFGEN